MDQYIVKVDQYIVKVDQYIVKGVQWFLIVVYGLVRWDRVCFCICVGIH